MRCTDPQLQIIPEELAFRASSEVTHCSLYNTNDADDAQFQINDLTLQSYEFNLRNAKYGKHSIYIYHSCALANARA